MELHEALTQIAEIRQQMARAQVFRGYRAATTAFSGIVAVAAGILQRILVPDAARDPGMVVSLWVVVAIVCVVVVGAEMVVRIRRSASQVQRQLTLLAVEQFVPSLVAGGLLTYIFCTYLAAYLAVLPGMWMILFSLGMFASVRLLPSDLFVVAAFYFVMGIVTLVMAGRGVFMSPWLMMGTFGVGQFSAATILYYRLERAHE